MFLLVRVCCQTLCIFALPRCFSSTHSFPPRPIFLLLFRIGDRRSVAVRDGAFTGEAAEARRGPLGRVQRPGHCCHSTSPLLCCGGGRGGRVGKERDDDDEDDDDEECSGEGEEGGEEEQEGQEGGGGGGGRGGGGGGGGGAGVDVCG